MWAKDLMYLKGSDRDYEEWRDSLSEEADMVDCKLQWAVIPGFSRYEVSTYGDVMSWVSGEPVLLQPWSLNHGHKVVCLRDDNGKMHKKLVHRLVAEAFIENPQNYPIVRHYDDDPANNYADNLLWGTQQDNVDDMFRNQHDFHKSVYCYETDKLYRSCAAAAKELGCSRALITNVCSGKTIAAKGYHLCYEEDIEERINNKDAWLQHGHGFKSLHARHMDTGEELYFNSRKEASEHLGIPECGISSTISGHTKHSHRWVFWED